MDTLVTKDVRQTHDLVIRHIAHIRARVHGLIDGGTAVMQLESNLGFECQHILHSLQEKKVKRWVALSEGAGGGIGWLTVRPARRRTASRLT